MGYSIRQRDCEFILPIKQQLPALHRLVQWMEKRGHDPDDKAFRWLNGVDHWTWDDMSQAFADWRFETERNDAGDITGLVFTGNKIGDEMQMFKIIAEYVEDGSYIEFIGGDNQMWRLQFVDDSLYEIQPPKHYVDQLDLSPGVIENGEIVVLECPDCGDVIDRSEQSKEEAIRVHFMNEHGWWGESVLDRCYHRSINVDVNEVIATDEANVPSPKPMDIDTESSHTLDGSVRDILDSDIDKTEISGTAGNVHVTFEAIDE